MEFRAKIFWVDFVGEPEIKFVKVGQLKEGSYVLIDGSVCQIRSFEKSKPGKHGAAKARITAFDIFTDQKKNLLKPTSEDQEVPIIDRGNAQVIAVAKELLHLMDTETYETFEIPVPKDVTGIKQGDEVEFLRYGANVRVLRKK